MMGWVSPLDHRLTSFTAIQCKLAKTAKGSSLNSNLRICKQAVIGYRYLALVFIAVHNSKLNNNCLYLSFLQPHQESIYHASLTKHSPTSAAELPEVPAPALHAHP